MRVRNNLDIGIAGVTHQSTDDVVHLPVENLSPAFVPQPSKLDEILQRPNLDQRVLDLLQPRSLDPTLLNPAMFDEVRRDLHDLFQHQALSGSEEKRRIMMQAALVLEQEVELQAMVSEALAALLQG